VRDVAADDPGPPNDLLEVLPVNATAASSEGGRIIVPSVELWRDCVRWQITQIPMPSYFSYVRDRGVKEGPAEDSAPRRPGRYSMRDDVGTVYEVSGATGGGDRHEAWVLHTTFDPAVPKEARRIMLLGGALGSEVITVHLPRGH
jgi:hypothetical protein